MTILSGTWLGRYEIRSQLGAGGMGEVYLAQDTKLDRRVALKILPADVAAHQDRMKRFVQEAKAASALNHPNIITIYEIDQADSVHFIATEFIDGETLRRRMKTAPIKLSEVLDIATQIGSALSAAHAAGIVHRDVKPENIMLRRDGFVKVLDFGLAKLVQTSGPAIDTQAATRPLVQTEPGRVMGTVAYMSPEQVRGLDLDARTDIWSLGVVLYEMLAGQVPFGGETSSHISVSILEKDPAPLTRHAHELPAELDRIVTKALTKDREERYQTAKDLLIDLRNLKRKLEVDAEIDRTVPSELRSAASTGGQGALATAPGVAPATATTAPAASSAEYIISEIRQHKQAAAIAIVALVLGAVGLGFYLQARNTEVAIDSIAVLPFVNQNSDPNDEWLSDGVTESIINSLTQLPNLKVVARSSVFRYEGRATDPLVAGKELGVRAILTGRVLQRGDNLLVSAELVDVRDNKQLWGEHYNRKLVDIIAIQEEIAKQISENLRLHLAGDKQNLLTKRYTQNTEAYELYLKGRFFFNKRTEEDIKKAIDYFQQAIAKDPYDALAYTGLSDALAGLVFPVGAVAPRESMPRARDAAMQALAIDNTLGEAHASLAYVTFFYDWNWQVAEQEFKRALDLNPNNADTHHWYSHYLMSQHRIDESLSESRRALELSPLDLILNIHMGWHYLYARQYDAALEQLNKVVDMDRNFAQAYPWLGLIDEQKSKYPEAIAAFKSAIDLFPGGSTQAQAELGHAYAVSGKKEQALKMIAELQELAKSKYVSPYQIATIYAGLGDKDQAFAWLEKAYQERSDWLVNLNRDQRLDTLHSDPRFADLVRRMGLPQ